MASLEIDERTANELMAAAAAQGVSVESFVRSLLHNTGQHREASAPVGHGQEGPLTAQQFLSLVEELSFDGPTLPADFSRADIYYDHD